MEEKVVESPITRLPVFIKAGGIMMMQDVVQSTSEQSKTLHLHLYYGKKDNAFEFYQDDGSTYDYEKGGYHKRLIKFSAKSKALELEKAQGKYKPGFKDLKIFFHGFKNISKLKINRKNAAVKKEDYRFVKPISSFDPLGKENEDVFIKELPFVETRYSNQKMLLEW